MHVLFDFNGVHEIASLSWYFCIKAKGQRKQLSYLNFLAFCLIKKQQKMAFVVAVYCYALAIRTYLRQEPLTHFSYAGPKPE